MESKKFSIGQAINFGWNTTKKNLSFFIVLLLVNEVIYYVPVFIARLLKEENTLLFILFFLLAIFLRLITSLGIMKIALKICDNQKPQISDLFSSFPLFFTYLWTTILFGLITVVGYIFFIIPGIFLTIMYGFYGYFIVDKNLGVVDSLKGSADITIRIKIKLFLFEIILVLINMLGALALLIGLFVSVPTTMIAKAYVYRKLSNRTNVSQL